MVDRIRGGAYAEKGVKASENVAWELMGGYDQANCRLLQSPAIPSWKCPLKMIAARPDARGRYLSPTDIVTDRTQIDQRYRDVTVRPIGLAHPKNHP